MNTLVECSIRSEPSNAGASSIYGGRPLRVSMIGIMCEVHDM